MARAGDTRLEPAGRREALGDLKLLGCFMRVAERGSVTDAAAALDLVPDSLARSIALLESRLGVKLFEPCGGAQVLTDPGLRLLDHCRDIFSHVQAFQREMRRVTSSPAALTVLGMPPTAGAILSDRIASRFLARLPRAKLRFVDGFSGHIREWLAAGRIDVGILYDSPACVGEELLTEELFLFGPRELLPEAPVCEFQALACLPMILPSAQHGLRQLVERHARDCGVALRVVIEIDSLATIIELVTGGVGVTILPLAAVDRAGVRLPRRRIVNPGLARTVILATSTNKPVSETSRILLEIVRQEALRIAQASKAAERRP